MISFRLAENLASNLNALIDTRALIQANSGAGKSWCLRRLLEQTHGRVQHLVIDPEGEFASLRERYDYVLAARHGGDTAADPRTARLLAERLLELGVSAILDIYELKAHERVRFVRQFLEALIDAPKKLWHPALVVVDEAHIYCPQQGEAESAGAVIDLATRGRKRGFCAILATQRLAKLHKDAAAECNNKLIGRTGLDIDVRRAADELGFGKERWRDLRDLEAGQFFAFGPALSRSVVAVKIGPVQTTHPKAGARLAFSAPPPTAKVKALLPKLADLPAEAEERQKTIEDLHREAQQLRRELTEARRAQPTPPAPKRVEVRVVKPSEFNRAEKLIERAGKVADRLNLAQVGFGVEASRLASAIASACQQVAVTVPSVPARTPIPAPPRAATASRLKPNRDDRLPVGERSILTALGQYPSGCTREQLSVLTGYKRSSRDTYMQRLREKSYAEVSDGRAIITDEGRAVLGDDFRPLPTGLELREYWLKRLPIGEGRILSALISAYPAGIERSVLDTLTEYQRSSRDTYLQRLRARQLVEIISRGEVRASPILFSD